MSRTALRAVKTKLDDAIRAGVLAGYKNADEVLDAFMKGQIRQSSQNGFIVKTLFNESTDANITKTLAEYIVGNQSFINTFTDKTQKEFILTLKQMGYSDPKIDELVKTWIEKGNVFKSSVISNNVVSDFARFLSGNLGREARIIINRMTKSLNTITREKDLVFNEIAKKIRENGVNADVRKEVSKLTELAAAAKRSQHQDAKRLLELWLSETTAITSKERRNFITSDNWYKTWSDLVDNSKKTGVFDEYIQAWGKLNPFGKISGTNRRQVLSSDFWTRFVNLIVYASPYKRSEIIGMLSARGVVPTVARRVASNFIVMGFVWPIVSSVLIWFINLIKNVFGGSQENLNMLDIFWEEFKNSEPLQLDPTSLTYLDEAYRILKTGSKDAADEIINNGMGEDYEEVANMIGEGETNDKTTNLQNVIKEKYPNLPTNIISQFVVNDSNKVVFNQMGDDGNIVKTWPVKQINGKIYIINTQLRKKFEINMLSSVNEGLIKILGEQSIDWGSGESLEISDFTPDSWDEFLGGGETDTSSGEEPTSTGLGDIPNIIGGTNSVFAKYDLGFKSDDSTVENDFNKLRKDMKSRNQGLWTTLRILHDDSGDDRIVMLGDIGGKYQLLDVEKNSSGEWGWINPEDPQREWASFDTYKKPTKPLYEVNESKNKIMKILREELEKTSLSQMIDDKLREFNFYSANDKGKQKVVFTDEDREEISREFDDLIKKYPEDVAFIRSVVVAKGEDKKTGEPVVRLGSFYDTADINLPFKKESTGLGSLLDGGIIYFTIINNEGPDYRDFQIVSGDKIPEVEFKDKDKEEIELNNYTHSHDQEMAEMDEPFENVMKKKEQKGLVNLLNKGEVTNELTKKQKEVLENLKKQGYKFGKKPEQGDIYERVRINSKEFNESIKAWRPKKR